MPRTDLLNRRRAAPLLALSVVFVVVPTGCWSKQCVSPDGGGVDSADSPRQEAATGPRLDGSSRDGSPQAPELASRDLPQYEGGTQVDGVARAEGGTFVEAGWLEVSEAGADAEARRETEPADAADLRPADQTQLAVDADPGDTRGADGAGAGRDAYDGPVVPDVAEPREAGSPVEVPGALDGGAGLEAGSSGERIWVYVLAGQSNMAGAAMSDRLAPDDSAAVPGATIYLRDPLGWNGQAGQWLPLGPGFGAWSYCFGPELAFGRRLHELNPSRKLALIKVAEGGTGLYDRWKVPTGDLYQLLLREVRTQLGVLAARGRPQLAGFVWMQGESDAGAQAPASAYQQNLTDLITALRRELGSALLPVVGGLIATDYRWPYANQVREATRQVGAQLGRTEVIETDDLSMIWDGTAHYDVAGTLGLGRRFADAMASMQGTRWRFPEDLAAVQGDGCWSYRDRGEAGTVPLLYDAAGARWTGAGGVAIGKGGMLPAAGHAAELSFWAPFAGQLEVVYRATMSSPESAGVRIEVVGPSGMRSNSMGLAFPTSVWSTSSLPVAQGDEISFRTGPGPTPDPRYDTTTWQIEIAMTRVDE
jgi:hypothetical protein